ncbi:MAG TPA: hypothetical protein VKU01_27370 [Bryobacteraceae bacterium]|nr:hypothetical protein [Bryobacteraceae bacterium]
MSKKEFLAYARAAVLLLAVSIALPAGTRTIGPLLEKSLACPAPSAIEAPVSGFSK